MSAIPNDYSLEPAAYVFRHDEVDAATLRGINRSLSKRVHGVFASRKNHKPIPWRNRDEHSLFGLLEIDPTVIAFRGMPEQVHLMFGGARRAHVPSAWVDTHAGPLIMDAVKADSDFHQRLTSIYAERGLAYRVVSSKVLHVLPRAANARWVLSHRMYHPAAEAVLDMTAALSRRRGERRLGELMAELPSMYPAETICSMALDGQVQIDLAATDRMQMRVSLVAGAGR